MIINMQQGGVVPDRIIDGGIITPGTVNQVLYAGTYLREDLTIAGDSNLIPENIKENIGLFDVTGTCKPNDGLNVWNVCDVKPNQVVTINIELVSKSGYPDYINTFKLTPSDANFDLSLLDDSFFVGLCFGDNNYRAHFESKTSGYFKAVETSATRDFTATFDTSSGLLALDTSTFSYMTDSVTYKSGNTFTIPSTIIKFIVSNDSSEYPNGDYYTDGYYYELLASASSTNAMSLSDNAVDAVSSQIVNEVSE